MVQKGGAGLIARSVSIEGASALNPQLPVNLLPASAAADRARQLACKQQRLYAQQKLDAKRLRWKEVAATTKANCKSMFPERQKAAVNRSHTGGAKFREENKGVWLPASQL